MSCINVRGTKYWYKDGTDHDDEYNLLHRLDGPAVEHDNGSTEWYKDGQLHRLDGPAYEHAAGNYKVWFFEGKQHRMDGPAIEGANGNKRWFYHGEEIMCSSTEEFIRIVNLKVFW